MAQPKYDRKCLMTRPLIIGIGGAHSGAGKTTVAAALLKHVTHNESSSLPITQYPSRITPKRWGAIKYTKTDFYTSLIDDRALLDRKDKDTGKLLSAGAEEVLWIHSPREGLEEIVEMAIDRLSHLDGIIIEGNSAIEFSNPDIVIFIVGSIGEMEKASALRLIEHADILVLTKSGNHYPEKSGDENVSACRSVYFDPEDKTTTREFLDCMNEVIEEHILDKIKQLLKDKAVDGRLTCSAARQIAEELKAPYREVGKAADELKIKIKNCELGCF